MIAANNVTLRIGKKALFEDVNIKFTEGNCYGLIGANGAGKSTTFKLILGLIRPESGEVTVFDHAVEELTVEDRQQIGVVLSDAGFSEYLTIKDLFPILEALYPAFDKERFCNYCERFSLPMDKKVREFSTGMKAKLKVLTAISNKDARLLILDEPTAGLDVMVREEILDLLREFMIPGDRSILISSHISSDLEGLCDDIYMIHEGKIILHETMDTILNDYGVIKVTEEQWKKLDKSYLLKKKKESYGYACLTKEKRYYMENHPGVAVENGSLDEVIVMMIQGETV